MKETLKEAAEWFADDEPNCDYEAGIKTGKYQGFIEGASWQMERMYSEEEVKDMLIKYQHYLTVDDDIDADEWFEQFKKKQ